MKFPNLPKWFALRSRRKLHAATVATRRAQPAEDYDDEPQTRLSSAFVVVLILHVVAVGGIYAFNSIKAHRAVKEPAEIAPATAAKGLPTPEVAELPVVAAQTNVAPAPTPSPTNRVHHVKAGDNPTKIALQYNVTVAELEESNSAKAMATLRPGQTLTIPAKKAKKPEEPPVAAAAGTKTPPKTYLVAKGDTPVAIARKLNVSQAELLKLNNIEDPKKLKIGQTLKVPAAKKN